VREEIRWVAGVGGFDLQCCRADPKRLRRERKRSSRGAACVRARLLNKFQGWNDMGDWGITYARHRIIGQTEDTNAAR
jgi:hypothetical protein